MAYEGYFHWKNWEEYLGVADERGLAGFKNTGGLVLGNESENLLNLLSKVGVEFEVWDYDKSDLAGFYLAIGTSGNQFKNAPVVGRLMAELIDSCENGYDHDRKPLKLTGSYTGHVLNAGFYSRLRELHTDSSFSVVG